jgi:xanthine dehydrogenase YagR molybdenum-binding subunit
MANTPDYSWPPMESRKVIGKPIKRLDGPAKSTGRAKYASDTKPKDMLFAVYVHNPHAHARVTSVDTSDAEKMPGVKAVHVAAPAGTECMWEGWEIAAVAATTEHAARQAAGKIKVEYEVLPHLVKDDNPKLAAGKTKQGGEKVVGDPDQTFKDAEVVSEGKYGIPIINHCCLEPHGAVIQWQGDKVMAWPSTQDVTTWAGQLSPNIKVDAANIKVKMDYIGGGFGSKFGPDAWGAVAATLSQKAGGRPVKLFLERDAEQMIAGNRPPAYGSIKIAGKKDGTITGWQSDTWSTGNMPLPYIIDQIPNLRVNHATLTINSGPPRAWRAPNNQQVCYLTCGAVEDFAAKIGMDPIEVFKKAVEHGPKPRVDTYKYQLDKAAEVSDWKKLWKPRGTSTGPVKRGLGVAISAWGGGGHNSNCRTTINPDGSVLVEIGTQDLGTGTRTIITQVAAESLGLPMSKVKLAIGTNDLPPDAASGGSSTVGGVTVSTRRSAVNAVNKLFEAAAPSLGAQPEDLEAVDGHIRVKGSPNKSITWEAACKKIGPGKISEMGQFNRRQPAPGMNDQGAAGVQIADVSVDTETGIVKINRYTAVTDCGLIVNPRLAESQIFGGIIMGISTALYEQRFLDQQTGKYLNADMEMYKLAGIGDIGDIKVHLDIRPENDKRGVIGLGEPCAVAICAAIGNAVTNAIGVRVPHIPMTPMHVLDALEGRIA